MPVDPMCLPWALVGALFGLWVGWELFGMPHAKIDRDGGS